MVVDNKIRVKDRSMTEWVTVQVLEDGIVWYCNHEGAEKELVTFDEGLDTEYSQRVWVCDKCAAWSDDGEGWF